MASRVLWIIVLIIYAAFNLYVSKVYSMRQMKESFVDGQCAVGRVFTNMFCARLKGVRANFQMADKPGSLPLLFSKIAELGGNIVSVVTRESEIAGNRRVTIKVLDVELEPVNKILEDCGATIIDIRVA